MKNTIEHNALLSDADLLHEVKRLTADERQATARLIAALGELDARRLYLGEGCSSLSSPTALSYADGGATTAENLELRCRAHNAYESERWFGVTEVDLVREAEATYSVQTES